MPRSATTGLYETLENSNFPALPGVTIASGAHNAVIEDQEAAINVTADQLQGIAWTDAASASTVDLGAIAASNIRITGTTTINSFGTVRSGITKTVRFAGALTLTYNATSMILPGAASITTSADDTAVFVSLGSGNWICVSFLDAAGIPTFGAGWAAVLAAAIGANWATALGAALGTRQATLLAADAADDAGGVKAGLMGALTPASTATTTINAGITLIGQDRRNLDCSGDTVTLDAEPTNTYGVPFTQAKILVPSLISPYNTQLNTYADWANGLMIARENLSTWWKSITAGTFQNIYLYGDSTVETDGAFPVKPHTLFKMALYTAGVNGCLTVNRGVSGTSWGDLNAIPDLASTTKLIVIKYGINDEVLSSNLATMAAAMRSKLTAIRADADGGYDDLSILLMGPNSTYRPSTGQDASWYEDLRNLYVQICKEFNCAYFDTYAYLQQTKYAPGLWLDSFDGGQGIHPDPVAVYWIWYEGIKTFVLGDGQWNTQKATQHWNITHATTQQFPTSEPQTYPFGFSAWGVLASDGWLADGNLITHRQADGVTVQTLYTLDTQPRAYQRTGTGLVWTQWIGVRTAVSAFTNSWVNKAGGYATAGYVLLENGMVKLYGVIKDGVTGSSAFTLPANLRPSAVHWFPDGNVGNVTVWPNGTVIPTTADVTTVSLDAILFPAVNP
jgi:hypothetical protein